MSAQSITLEKQGHFSGCSSVILHEETYGNSKIEEVRCVPYPLSKASF